MFSFSGFGAALVRFPWPCDRKYARSSQQRPRSRPLPRVWQTVPMEAAQPRRQRSYENFEARSPLLQMYSLHSNLWTVQAVRKPCLLSS